VITAATKFISDFIELSLINYYKHGQTTYLKVIQRMQTAKTHTIGKKIIKKTGSSDTAG
jgi:hypothetical protein